MSNQNTAGKESVELEPRTRRALERVASVLHTDGTPIAADDGPSMVAVVSGNSGREHTVDLREERCTCADHRHRGAKCYHIRRAEIALGIRPVATAELAAADIDAALAEHAPGPKVLTSDGGIIEAGDDGEILDDEPASDDARPNDCACGDWNADGPLPCWPCYRDGFDEPASAE